MNPYQPDQPLMEVMPRLQEHLKQLGRLSDLTVYDGLSSIVRDTQSRPPVAPNEHPIDQDHIHMEACHFLRLAYAWLSEQFDSEVLRSWQWYEWLNRHGPDVETILSYNYDLVLERTLRIARLGKVYGWTRQNPIFGSGLSLEPSEIYVDELDGDRRVIHIAKPHGSCNFSGWARREISDEHGRRPLYPIETLLLRDSTLRVLDDLEIHNATHTADLVLPGEWPCWGASESTRVEWAVKHKEFFVNESRSAQKLLLVGFGYGEPDRPEFDALVGRIDHFEEVHVVHPEMNPPNELMAVLETKFRQRPTVWSSPRLLMAA